ncbi:hypothetical protein GPECTOR_667g796 [Gonium pectorale]|uniref:Uncharacterized protein n=1 Tax=Gonium pectorale TaxID=33097 RepID=A0A150FUA0_GONPE|nr:hypothetical protein GPECTOR_667g796 [Gonium pectorale]|eukprot:KXZ41192.1 hypothetical protein GPECTOR_667g796 [Gonium pectorale]
MQRKLNYGLHDSVVRLPVLDKVKDARKATIDSKPDILGLRGPTWNDSVALKPGKHHTAFSEAYLSNTLSPDLLNSKDVRKLAGSTACRADRDAATLDRSRSPSHQPGGAGWNISTVAPNALEWQRNVDATTRSCQAATRRRSPPAGYVPPVARTAAYSEAVRAAKASSGADMRELTARYGPEGAQALAASLALPPGRPVRIRATREDVAAVRGLEAFSPGQEEPEDAGEAVPLGPAGGA